MQCSSHYMTVLNHSKTIDCCFICLNKTEKSVFSVSRKQKKVHELECIKIWSCTHLHLFTPLSKFQYGEFISQAYLYNNGLTDWLEQLHNYLA